MLRGQAVRHRRVQQQRRSHSREPVDSEGEFLTRASSSRPLTQRADTLAKASFATASFGVGQFIHEQCTGVLQVAQFVCG